MLSVVVLDVVMLSVMVPYAKLQRLCQGQMNVLMLNVIMLSVVMLSVMAPYTKLQRLCGRNKHSSSFPRSIRT